MDESAVICGSIFEIVKCSEIVLLSHRVCGCLSIRMDSFEENYTIVAVITKPDFRFSLHEKFSLHRIF